MQNILLFPASTVVDRIVPKTMFYRFMEVNQKMKDRFVEDVVSIRWMYKLSAGTLNVTDSETMKEVEIFTAELKSPDCPRDLFTFIDANMPHHIVFILHYGGDYMILLNYKDWADSTHTKFKIVQSFCSQWVKEKDLNLVIEGQSLQRIYDNFVGQVSGIGEHKAGSIAKIVELKKSIAAKDSELKALLSKIKKEPQFNIQMKLNKKAKEMRTVIEGLKQELEKLK